MPKLSSKTILIAVASGLVAISAVLFIYSLLPDMANLILGVCAIAVIPVGVVWMLTRWIKPFWLRIIPRIVVIALVFGWVIVPAPELHGALRLPIPFALWAAHLESRWGQVLPPVAFSVAVTSLVLWCIAMMFWLIIRSIWKPRAVERKPAD